MRFLIFALLSVGLSFSALAEEVKSEAKAEEKTEKTAMKKKGASFRKTQEVNFDGSDIDGQVRSPDGAYLLQKRGVQFIPLYKVNNQFDKSILESVEYLR